MKKFCDEATLSCFMYTGGPKERAKLREKFDHHDVVVTSYENVRSDIEFLETQNFNYCILDEGHLIKNPKAKISTCVKKIQSLHRLLLTGTPIQVSSFEKV